MIIGHSFSGVVIGSLLTKLNVQLEAIKSTQASESILNLIVATQCNA